MAIASAEAAIDRVAGRVSQGGHFVPEHIVRRRFVAGRANLESVYTPLADAWALYDNSGARQPIEQAKNPLLAAALPALLRARQRAEEIAIATNTALVMVMDGKVARVYPRPDGTAKTKSVPRGT